MSANSSLKENSQPIDSDTDDCEPSPVFKFKRCRVQNNKNYFPRLESGRHDADITSEEQGNSASGRFFNRLNFETEETCSNKREVKPKVVMPRDSKGKKEQQKKEAIQRLKNQRQKKMRKKQPMMDLSSDSDNDFEMPLIQRIKCQGTSKEAKVVPLDTSRDLFSSDSDLEYYPFNSNHKPSTSSDKRTAETSSINPDGQKQSNNSASATFIVSNSNDNRHKNLASATFTVPNSNDYSHKNSTSASLTVSKQNDEIHREELFDLLIDKSELGDNKQDITKDTQTNDTYVVSIGRPLRKTASNQRMYMSTSGESSSDIEESELDNVVKEITSSRSNMLPTRTSTRGNCLLSNEQSATTSKRNPDKVSKQNDFQIFDSVLFPNKSPVESSSLRKRSSKGDTPSRPVGLPRPKKAKLACVGSKLNCAGNGIQSSSNSDSYASTADSPNKNKKNKYNKSKKNIFKLKKSQTSPQGYFKSNSITALVNGIHKSSENATTSSVKLLGERHSKSGSSNDYSLPMPLSNKESHPGSVGNATYVVNAASGSMEQALNNSNSYYRASFENAGKGNSSVCDLTEHDFMDIASDNNSTVDGGVASGVDGQLHMEGVMNPEFRSALSVWSSSQTGVRSDLVKRSLREDNPSPKGLKTVKRKKNATVSYSVPNTSITSTESPPMPRLGTSSFTSTRRRGQQANTSINQLNHSASESNIVSSSNTALYRTSSFPSTTQASNVITSTSGNTLFPPIHMQQQQRLSDNSRYNETAGSPSVLDTVNVMTPSDDVMRQTSTPLDDSGISSRLTSVTANRSEQASIRRLRHRPPDSSTYNSGHSDPVADFVLDDSVIVLEGEVEEGETPDNPVQQRQSTGATPGGAAAVHSVGQMETDEALARRLQEEMDMEFAHQVAQNAQTPTNPMRMVPRSGNTEDNSRMLSRIGRLTEYEWQVHRCIHLGEDIPPSPSGQIHRELDAILDPEILGYLENHPSAQHPSQSSGDHLVPQQSTSPTHRPRSSGATRATNLSARRRLSSEEQTAMLARIGSLTDDEWQVHRAVVRGDQEGLERLLQTPEARGPSSVDPHILEYLQYNSPLGAANELQPFVLAGRRVARPDRHHATRRRNATRRARAVYSLWSFDVTKDWQAVDG